ncbi:MULTISPECIES: DUF4397 domain-containing protein [Alteribacter]|nr:MULTISPECIES: DUF4397 domain-containing protein [Alteribacter]
MKLKRLMTSMLAGVMVFSIFSVTALADDHGDDDAWVRIVHASPDAPAVDVTVNGDVAVEGAAFKDATDYLELPAGEHDVAIYPAGEHDEPVIEATLEVAAGQAYTVAAINTLENLDLHVIEDETSSSEGMAWVRVGHLSPDAPAVDVTAGGDVLFAGAEFPSVTGYEEVEPMTADLDVRVAGTEDVVLELPGTELEGDMLYTVLAVGFADGEPGLDTIILADPSHDAMPSEMPATGMGGTADQSSSYMAAGMLIVLLASGALFFFFRRPAVENQ